MNTQAKSTEQREINLVLCSVMLTSIFWIIVIVAVASVIL